MNRKVALSSFELTLRPRVSAADEEWNQHLLRCGAGNCHNFEPHSPNFKACVQVVFYQGDLARMMNAVLHGEIDVCILPSGWLEENFPENTHLLQIIAPRLPLHQGEPYPFLTSTELVPEVGLSAAPYISSAFLQPIFIALIALNSSTNPAMRDARISTFTFAASYAATRQVGADVDIVHQSETTGGTTCHTQFQAPAEVLMCSQGYVQDSEHAVEIECTRRKLPCPQGLECVCKPCIPVREAKLFPWQVQARARAHSRSSVCDSERVKLHACAHVLAGSAGAVRRALRGRAGAVPRVECDSRPGRTCR